MPDTEPKVEVIHVDYPETPKEARMVFFAFLASDGNDQKLNRLAKIARKILEQEALDEIAASRTAAPSAKILSQASRQMRNQ